MGSIYHKQKKIANSNQLKKSTWEKRDGKGVSKSARVIIGATRRVLAAGYYWGKIGAG
jgi:hypothetical protein